MMPAPDACPECKEEDALVACGPGVERIADEVAALFPDARTAIVTSDTIWSPAKAAEFVARMEGGEIDIVIGTQLVTKGYHFPNLTLVGVVDADLGLSGGDLRAAERTFQQIQQVSGRAGRGEKYGRVLVQTHDPSAPVLRALVSGDAEGFYVASVPQLAGCHTQAQSLDTVMERIREAIELCLEVQGAPAGALEFIGIQRVTVAA